MSEHRVLDHLGLQAREYDAVIRTYIPQYEQMIAAVVGLVHGEIVDLGTGTGALAEAILHAHPTAHVKLVDIDPAMLEAAGARVARFGDRAELVRASFDAPLPQCDTVVASLALHHVPEIGTKRDLYRRIHDALRPGGGLIIGDATVHDQGTERIRAFETWSAWMATHGIKQADANALFAKWASEDRYLPLAIELQLLADAGFSHPECFWKYGPIAVYGGFR